MVAQTKSVSKSGTKAKTSSGTGAVAKSTKSSPSKTTKAATAPAAASAKAAGAVAQEPLRKKELIDAVVARSGIKKRDAKPVVEAMLAELGETLSKGRELTLPPLGRVHINRSKTVENGKVIILKMRQKKPAVKVD